MPKTTKKDFEKFIYFFNEWTKRFGLDYWQIYFEHKQNNIGYSAIKPDIDGYVARVMLAINWEDRKITDESLLLTAKHEAIHLLIARCMAIGGSRFVTSDEIISAEEELVRRLEKLI